MKLALVLAVSWLSVLLTAGGEKTTEFEWITDLDRGFELAAESGRPLLIVFR